MAFWTMRSSSRGTWGSRSCELAEGIAFDVLHHDEVEVALPAELVDLRHVRGADRGGQPSFLEEHLAPLGVARDVSGQDLDRDGTPKDRVLRLPDHAHSALADFLDQAVVR
jgi:hypothetical protein